MEKCRTKYKGHSGVFPLPLYTKPYPCGGQCSYCFREKNIPHGYLLNKDSKIAIDFGYSPIRQAQLGIKKIRLLNNISDDEVIKIEVIILGGSFTFFSHEFRKQFVKEIYDAFNGFKSESIIDAIICQSSAKNRCVCLACETRPDLMSDTTAEELAEIGVTKVELGVQSLDADVLRYNYRFYSSETVATATLQLKEKGLKVGYHMMTNLPNSTPNIDIYILSKELWRKKYNPDCLKIYPCLLLPNSGQECLDRFYQKGLWRPYSNKDHTLIFERVFNNVPHTCRIQRIGRQIERKNIIGGVNLISHKSCHCLRCSEVGLYPEIVRNCNDYDISIEERGRDVNFIAKHNNRITFGLLRGYASGDNAIVRELKVFGWHVPIKKNYHHINERYIQGNNIGKQLLTCAEDYFFSKNFKLMSILPGCGVSDYFKKSGFMESQGNYLQKKNKKCGMHTS